MTRLQFEVGILLSACCFISLAFFLLDWKRSRDGGSIQLPMHGDEEEEEVEEEPTSAAIIAEEGRGVIVRGDDTPVVRLQVAPGASRPHV